MRKMLTGITLAFGLAVSTAPANAATLLTSATVSGVTSTGSLSGAVWNTAVDGFWTVFLQQPLGTNLNPNDNFAGSTVTTGQNNYTIAGEGFMPGTTANSDPSYMLTLMFSDGASILGNYVGSMFTGGTSSTVGGTTYTLTGFGWDRSPADNVSRFSVGSGGDLADYTGQFSFRAVPAIPEPATWAMMLVGFGILGAFMRRKDRTTVRGRVNFA